MRILLIGGNGFIGTHVQRELTRAGHEFAIFHRRGTQSPVPASMHIYGDRNDLPASRAAFEQFAPDIVVDFILSSGRQAQAMMDTMRGIASRVVVLSSQDVYRACGILHGTETGPLQDLPIDEEGELRTNWNTYGPELLKLLREKFPWLDEEYDKIPVERAVLNDPALPATVLRLPMIYGPGDPLHRLFPILKRVDDGRPAILIQEDAARWRGPRGYVENVAAAIALAIESPRAVGRVYNVAEPDAYTEQQWTALVAEAAGWSGRVVPTTQERTPAHLCLPYRNEQHWVINSQRIRDELGYREPVPLAAALARTIEWERAYPPEIDARMFDYAAEDAALA